jgi:hypothetical protein
MRRSRTTGPTLRLDLGEVSLVDIDVVRFLGACQSKGVKLCSCAPYIRDWIALELERER